MVRLYVIDVMIRGNLFLTGDSFLCADESAPPPSDEDEDMPPSDEDMPGALVILSGLLSVGSH
jgi:hypothetical protein